ncbi:MAG: tRNA pseudouridine(38-40) synthase TruA [Actinobacteria bacterium RBG_16_64_13]|nr:MAG: tRNA pseudouridine(38-40) synthase TruA [Actinobacteria bacterium RBG_16_64_13]
MELQYDGTGLHGWAKQNGTPTVEGCLETALMTVLGSAPALRVAGRTDAGVHARRQVASLRLPAGIDVVGLTGSLNALTPPGIVVTRITRAPEAFDARKDARSRTYRYYMSTSPGVSPFWSRYCWQAPRGIDPASLRAGAARVVGRHDFTAFTPTETGHTFFNRLVLRCGWKRVREGLATGRPGAVGMLYLEIEADAFLRHMVRSLVGTMVEVALGKRRPSDFERLLAGAPREAAGTTAPAHGLFLWDVRYRPTGLTRAASPTDEERD